MIGPTPLQLMEQYAAPSSRRPEKEAGMAASTATLRRGRAANEGAMETGFQERRLTPEEVQRWSRATPDSFAIVTGRLSDRLTSDFGGEAGAVLARKWGVSPHRSTPSGGFHLDVTYPGWFVPTLNSKAKQELGQRWPGIDVKGDGGYVIAVGRNECGVYQWFRDAPPPALSRESSMAYQAQGSHRQNHNAGMRPWPLLRLRMGSRPEPVQCARFLRCR
jgi:hypothetical protein